MHIGEQVHPLFRLNNLQSVERSHSEVERFSERVFVVIQLLFGHFAHGEIYFLLWVGYLHDVIAAVVEVHAQLGMNLHYGPDGLSQCLRIGGCGECHLRRDIVHDSIRIVHAVCIDAHLGKRQRHLCHHLLSIK